ncbi:hypothetical protein CFP56_000411 [Quercus suber]|uniref:Secreted protein n=1 Tax=Quercus suber TaxID=58331 RepID=A0AAW0MB02_QUESU
MAGLCKLCFISILLLLLFPDFNTCKNAALYSLYMLQCQLQHPLHRQQLFHLSLLLRLQILMFHLLQHKALLLLLLLED